MVATGQEMVREKNSSRSGKSQGISLQVRENFSLWKKSGKSEVLSQSTFCTFYGHESCYIVHEIEEQADVGFSRKSILFALNVKKLSIFIHVHHMCLAESINWY